MATTTATNVRGKPVDWLTGWSVGWLARSTGPQRVDGAAGRLVGWQLGLQTVACLKPQYQNNLRAHNKIEWAQRKDESSNKNKKRKREEKKGKGKSEEVAEKCANV